MRVLRNNEDTLMTVLETFLHDPAVDMVKKVGLSDIETKTQPPSQCAILLRLINIIKYSQANR